jgi:hypothetical protein
MNQSGEVLLQAELSVPAGEFRCIDIPYDELLRAGFEPDPTTGALTFRVRIPASSQGGGKTASVGTLMNIDSLTGKVELYQNTERELVDILQTIKRDLDAGTSNFEN